MSTTGIASTPNQAGPVKPHRIAAGAIVIREAKVLLVRYRDAQGATYLVAPGGGVEDHESVADAAIREVREETGICVETEHVVAVEDLLCTSFKMCKIWLLCRFISGDVRLTDEARFEGIVEARWYDRSDLNTETVYPVLLKEVDWSLMSDGTWQAYALPIRSAAI